MSSAELVHIVPTSYMLPLNTWNAIVWVKYAVNRKYTLEFKDIAYTRRMLNMLVLNSLIAIMCLNYNILDILDSTKYIIKINFTFTFYNLRWLLKPLKLRMWLTLDSTVLEDIFISINCFSGIKPSLIYSPYLSNGSVYTALIWAIDV